MKLVALDYSTETGSTEQMTNHFVCVCVLAGVEL